MMASLLVWRTAPRSGVAAKWVALKCSPNASGTAYAAVAAISTAPPSADKPKPWPYRQKQFLVRHQLFDRTARRFDENSKVIVIDGPIASGKHDFARRLAKKLNFFFVPEVPSDEMFKVHGSGADLRDLDELLPSSARLYDLRSFYEDPHPSVAEGGGRAGSLQLHSFIVRLYTYNDALLHLFSTGQGVVCVRSPWSDHVFATALTENGFISKRGYAFYKTVSQNAVCEFPRPHLTIYLDASVSQVKQNLINRDDPLEKKALGKILTDNYLKSIERSYKDQVLPAMKSHGELMVYPHIAGISDHEIDLVAEDIEALGDLRHSGIADDNKFEDWRVMKDEELAVLRRQWGNERFIPSLLMHPVPYDCPEMVMSPVDEVLRSRLYFRSPLFFYTPGWVPGRDSWRDIIFGAFRKAPELRKFYVPPVAAV